MGNFGKTKLVIINKLTDLYTKGNKSGVKKIFKLIKENNDFRKMYVFYEEIEKMHFEDRVLAESYVNTLTTILPAKIKSLEKSGFVINEDSSIEPNPVYDLLDILSEEISLSNMKQITHAKNELVNYLITPKPQESLVENYTMNERLLYAVLVNGFNEKYLNELTEEQQTELHEILHIDNDSLAEKIISLKESILLKVNGMLSESVDEVKDKLTDVKTEVELAAPSKYNYYRLCQLKNGLD